MESGRFSAAGCYQRSSGQLCFDEIPKGGKICGEVLPDTLHRHTHVGVSHDVAETDDGPPWDCWIAFLDVIREPACGIGKDLHPPDPQRLEASVRQERHLGRELSIRREDRGTQR